MSAKIRFVLFTGSARSPRCYYLIIFKKLYLVLLLYKMYSRRSTILTPRFVCRLFSVLVTARGLVVYFSDILWR
ncbi:hypothetical protein CLU79DRAFT_762734 [Phycomyces nitens]|nr:hypothetical protein CLU79DRAFT_762734 [Phycomyces nitens]